MSDEIRNQWESNAEAFSKLISDCGTPHHREILNPAVEELLGNVDGKSLLDAGCGEGYLSRYYAKKGAIVTGVDISHRLILMAKEFSQKNSIKVEFMEGDICHLEGISDESYDVVLCNLVLLNIPNYEEAIMEFYRVLRTQGTLVVSIVHPAFDFYGPGSWEMGERNQRTGRKEGLFFKMDRYTSEVPYEVFWKTREGNRFPEPITFYHRTISSYFRVMRDAGFYITDLREPLPTSQDDFFEREQRIPFFMVFKAIRRKP